jgi:very-short-patch-repair endonuclease
MRADPTEAEKRLWSRLRDLRFAHCKFRRQQIIDFYIADFVSLSERLVIEADGSQHADSDDDLRRDNYLRSQGFRVLRFWNNAVLAEPEAVSAAIFAAVQFPHPPKPSAWAPPSPEMGEGADYAVSTA